MTADIEKDAIGNRDEPTRQDLEAIGAVIVDSAVRVHRTLGPCLLETAYQRCLTHELRYSGFKVRCEVLLPLTYRSLQLDCGYRVDMIINESVIVENKSVERVLPVHSAQILTYLHLSGLRLGYLLNWNVSLMKNGIRRFVNGL